MIEVTTAEIVEDLFPSDPNQLTLTAHEEEQRAQRDAAEGRRHIQQAERSTSDQT